MRGNLEFLSFVLHLKSHNFITFGRKLEAKAKTLNESNALWLLSLCIIAPKVSFAFNFLLSCHLFSMALEKEGRNFVCVLIKMLVTEPFSHLSP